MMDKNPFFARFLWQIDNLYIASTIKNEIGLEEAKGEDSELVWASTRGPTSAFYT
jgi:hypothetical protein